ncbi:MAG: phage major capsid protein [Pseudarthrobacter sp.]
MSFANASVTDIVATTIESRSKKIADNVTKNNAILALLEKKGNVRPFSGGVQIFEELSFAENGNFGWYSGYDLLPVAAQDVISAATFSIKQAACPVVISGLEELQNSGKEAFIDLLEARIKVAEAPMANNLTAGVYSDGTGFGGKQLTGLQAAVVASPTTGVYGGIDRSTTIGTFWRNQTTGSLGAQTASTIQTNMNSLYAKLVRGKDRPKVIVFDNSLWSVYMSSLQAIQRFSDPEMAELGFDNVKFMSAPVVLDGGLGGFAPANTGYFLNTDYLFLRPHKDRNMVPLSPKRRVAINQDAEVEILAWAGNMTCSNASLQGFFQGY